MPMVRNLLIIAIATLLGLVQAKAVDARDLLKAVGFALTGTDDAEVGVVDRRHWIFAIGTEVFFLNNVEVDRLDLRSVVSAKRLDYGEEYVLSDLHGGAAVYENATQVTFDPTNQLDVAIRQNKPDFFEPKRFRSNEHPLVLHTREADRVKRAWKFIYSHGCSGARSRF
jgi:hypothetical protein